MRSAGSSAAGSAHEPARPDIDAHHAVPAVEPGELDLVGAHEPRALDIDQLAVEHVFLQQHLLRATFEPAEVELYRAQRRTTLVDFVDLRGRDEDLAAGDRREQASDGWIPVLSEPNNQVVDAAELTAFAIVEPAAGDERQVQNSR